MLYLFMWHHGDGGCYWWSSPQRSLRKTCSVLCEIEISPYRLQLFSFHCLHSSPRVKSSKAAWKLVKGFIIWRACCKSPLLLSSASSKIPAAAVMCDRNIYCGKRASGGSRAGSSWRWRIVAFAFNACVLPSQTCPAEERPHTPPSRAMAADATPL